jgi:UDP-glucose 4-epimerase
MACFLITGVAGFIGSAVARRLLAAGHEVVAIDNLSTGYRENVPEGTIFFEADCQDAGVYSRLPKRSYAAIYHIAGQSSGEISFDNPVYDLQTNTQSTLLLLRFAMGNQCRRFLYASTMSVYGDQPDAPVPETASTFPRSFYGVGKLASEHYLRIYAQFGIESVALRLFNVYGPGQNLQNLRQGMISIYLAQALKSDEIHVKGSGDRFRDFVFIDDVVDAFLTLGQAEVQGYSVYNVGTGVKTGVSDLLAQIVSGFPDRNIRTRYEGVTPGDMFGIFADCTAIARDHGWQARISLSQGLSQMTRWAASLPGSEIR